jgi:DNA topoisomerase-1
MPATKSARKKPKKKKYTLVIVESPAKAKTINKYLGSKYVVVSSMGHIIDLPKSRLGVNVDENFTPEYITIRGKGKILNELKKHAAKSNTVLLASDNDREGEAIAYHIRRVLLDKYPDLIIKRIVFNEITKDAIIESISHQRNLEDDKVNAQKTRRILDRLVGYNISPILWAKVKSGLSAGRVQSVTLRIICERESEIDAFIPVEYWTLSADFAAKKKKFSADLFKVNGEKPQFNTKSDIDTLLSSIESGSFHVSTIKTTSKSVKPTAPFITSKLQQVAANRLGYTSKKTMSIAQQLYEGIDIGKETVGLITYMRTDSTRISDFAIGEVRKYIGDNYPNALPRAPLVYSKSNAAQDAHEAIRPTSVFRDPASMKQYLSKDQFKLYSLIWEKFVSSQMTNAEYRNSSILIENGPAVFKISRSELVDKGYIAALNLLKSKDAAQKKLPPLNEGDTVDLVEYFPEQHFTQPPPRYTDASIIKLLEENGIGRPSTYAPTISTLIYRYYITRKNKQLVPTVLGRLVNNIMVDSFPDIVDADFTVNMEKKTG